MARPAIHNDEIVIYASSAWRNEQNRKSLHRLLEPQWRQGVDFHDVAMGPHHPLREKGDDLALAREIRERIRFCDVFLVLAGTWPKDRDWIEREIAFAFALGKPIIPVAPYLRVRRSSVTTELATHEVVRWRGDAVRGAIWRSLSIDRRELFFDRLQTEKRELERLRAQIASQRDEHPRGLPGRDDDRLAPPGLPAAARDPVDRLLPAHH